MFKPYDNPIHRFAPPMLESCMVYDDTTKTIYDISDKTSYHVGILAQLEPYRDFNNNTDLRFKWSAYSGEYHPVVPAITTQFLSMSSPFALGLCKVNDYFL